MLDRIRGGLVASLVIEVPAVRQMCGPHLHFEVIRSASWNLARNFDSLLSTCRRHSVPCILVHPSNSDLWSAPSMLSLAGKNHASHALVDSCAFHGCRNRRLKCLAFRSLCGTSIVSACLVVDFELVCCLPKLSADWKHE